MGIVTTSKRVSSLKKLVEEQATIISSLRKQVDFLISGVEVVPVEAFEDKIVHHSNIRIERSKRLKDYKMERMLQEMQELITVCSSYRTSRFQKDKAKDRLSYLDKVRSTSHLYGSRYTE